MRRSYYPVVCSGSQITCETSRVVYLVTCKRCSLQYIGQTKHKLKERVREHRLSILHNESSRYLVSHFNTSGHTIDDFSVQIAEVVSVGLNLADRENFWIRLLNTAYPFGLNDNVSGYGNISEGLDPLQKANHPYFCVPLPVKRPKKPHKNRRSKVLNQSAVQELNQILEFTGEGVYHAIQFLKKQTLRTIKHCYTVVLSDSSISNHLKVFLLAFLAGYYRNSPKNVNKAPVDRVVIPYWNHNIAQINFKHLFNCSQLRRTCPVPPENR